MWRMTVGRLHLDPPCKTDFEFSENQRMLAPRQPYLRVYSSLRSGRRRYGDQIVDFITVLCFIVVDRCNNGAG